MSPFLLSNLLFRCLTGSLNELQVKQLLIHILLSLTGKATKFKNINDFQAIPHNSLWPSTGEHLIDQLLLLVVVLTSQNVVNTLGVIGLQFCRSQELILAITRDQGVMENIIEKALHPS